jgi:hypothetical protein
VVEKRYVGLIGAIVCDGMCVMGEMCVRVRDRERKGRERKCV